MATNFPSSLDTSTQQPTIASSDDMDASGKEHDVVHTNHSGAIIALETKLGTGDSNATANAVLIGTGSGTSGWDTSPTFKGAVTVGVDDTGHDVKFFGATSGKYMEWDESADQLDVTGSLDVTGNTSMVGTLNVGVDDTGHDVKFFGATASKYMLWDESADALIVKDTVDAVNFKVNGGQGSDGQVLTSTGSGVAWEDAGGGGGSPAGSDTQIQFNNSGSFGADSQMSFTAATGLDVSPSTYSGNFLGCALRIKGEGGTTWQSGSIFYVDKDDVRMARVGFDNGTTTWTWKMSYHSSMSAWLSLGSQSGTYFAIGGQGGVVSYANRTSFHPGTDNLTDIGTSSYRWVDIYATNGTIQTSDVALKKDITNTSLGLDFINSLRPVEYKWKDGGVRSHQGFIAQEVETALDASASSASDQAMWSQHGVNGASKGIEHYWEDYEEGEVMEREIDLPDYQSLRYNELIAPLVKAVQELTTRVAALEG
jgi:hypothetical protein